MSPPGREDTSREHDTGSTQEKDMDTSPCDSDFGEEGLRDNLYSFLLENKSQFDKTPHEFLPRDKLDGIFSAQSKQGQDQTRNVFKPMGINSTSPTNEDLSLTEYILNNCQKLYLIAVFIELKPKPLRTLMSIFRQNEFTDKKLPIDMWGANEIKAGIRKPPFHPLVVMEKQYEPTRTLRIWDLISISKFQKEQWKFLIPTISTKEILHDFGQHTIPFSVKHEFEGKGGNGIVHKYEIHHAHFEDTSPPIKSDESSRVISAQRLMSNVVAVKQIRKEGKEVARRCEKEVRALAKMNSFNHKHIVRFVTSFRRQGTSGGIEHYVIFEWADGGNLTDFRAAHPNPEMTVELVKWTIQQLCGLAQALAKAHYLDDDGSYRHGDLKPANILWFKQGDTKFGTLKIGDWGEAKEHYNGTALRHNTTAQCGTRRYEPPEVQTGLKLKLSGGSRFVRSRLYDIWGIGCITLEILIWLMYGLGELKRFERESAGTYGASDLFYEVSSGKPAKVHGNVEHWMSEMAVDPRCFPDKTALGDLLKIVRTGLLIVKLPREGGIKRPHGPSDHVSETLESKSNKFRSSASATKTLDTGHSDTPSIQVTEPVEDEVTKALEDPTLASPGEARRCLATDFEDGLQKILANDQDESYWFSGDASKPAPHAFRRPDFLSAEAGAIASTRDAPSHWYNGTAQIDYGTKNPVDLETWNFEYDNDFARLMFSRWNDVRLSPPKAAPVSNMLCHQCMGICGRVSNPYFEETYEVAKLKWSKGTCDLCNMFWNAQEKFPRTPSSSKVKFHRQMGSYMIMMDGLKSPVLTLFRNNESRRQAIDVQIGLADLPEPGKEVHIEILRGWLDDCDHHRDHKCAPSRAEASRVPTRLIDVGTNGSDTVQLREMDPSNTDDWVALSYRWGPAPHFSTTSETLKAHLAGISLNQLPRTFRDAIHVTRRLRKRYLWIDSLCIIQGKGGDFREESKRMEDVYSGAYCVLAASCAKDQTSGFLFPRKARNYVALKANNDTDGVYFVCEWIENFKKHVLDGELCGRGWVLQEHALARRTIFFTEHQTYWECGKGVRCETLAKMSNTTASLLGDPEFPNLLDPTTAKKGEQIYHWQDLYSSYSRLNLSNYQDRPAAIDGLQKRLLRKMNVQGGFGLFDDPDDSKNKGFLRRSLLWRRGNDALTLCKIHFDDPEMVPSWSWMAVSGGISYFHPQFTGFDWKHIKPPWLHPTQADTKQIIEAQVTDFELPGADSEEHEVIFDDSGRSKQGKTKAIVLGIEKLPNAVEAKRHYILLVDMMAEFTPDGHKYCKRVGAGYLPGKWLTGAETPCALI